jgi:hypothetical protein
MRQVVIALFTVLIAGLIAGCSQTPTTDQLKITFGNGDSAVLVGSVLKDGYTDGQGGRWLEGILEGGSLAYQEGLDKESIDAVIARPGVYLWNGEEDLEIKVTGPNGKPFCSKKNSLHLAGLYSGVFGLAEGDTRVKITLASKSESDPTLPAIKPISLGVWKISRDNEGCAWALIPGSRDNGVLVIVKR